MKTPDFDPPLYGLRTTLHALDGSQDLIADKLYTAEDIGRQYPRIKEDGAAVVTASGIVIADNYPETGFDDGERIIVEIVPAVEGQELTVDPRPLHDQNAHKSN